MDDTTNDKDPPAASGKPLEPWIDQTLEARIVALVLGEASDFETAELLAEIAAQRELQTFHERIRSAHAAIGRAESPAAPQAAGWKLPSEKRSELLALFQDPAPPASVARQPAQAQQARDQRRRRASLIGLGIAATIALLLGGVTLLNRSVQLKSAAVNEKTALYTTRETDGRNGPPTADFKSGGDGRDFAVSEDSKSVPRGSQASRTDRYRLAVDPSTTGDWDAKDFDNDSDAGLVALDDRTPEDRLFYAANARKPSAPSASAPTPPSAAAMPQFDRAGAVAFDVPEVPEAFGEVASQDSARFGIAISNGAAPTPPADGFFDKESANGDGKKVAQKSEDHNAAAVADKAPDEAPLFGDIVDGFAVAPPATRAGLVADGSRSGESAITGAGFGGGGGGIGAGGTVASIADETLTLGKNGAASPMTEAEPGEDDQLYGGADLRVDFGPPDESRISTFSRAFRQQGAEGIVAEKFVTESLAREAKPGEEMPPDEEVRENVAGRLVDDLSALQSQLIDPDSAESTAIVATNELAKVERRSTREFLGGAENLRGYAYREDSEFVPEDESRRNATAKDQPQPAAGSWFGSGAIAGGAETATGGTSGAATPGKPSQVAQVDGGLGVDGNAKIPTIALKTGVSGDLRFAANELRSAEVEELTPLEKSIDVADEDISGAKLGALSPQQNSETSIDQVRAKVVSGFDSLWELSVPANSSAGEVAGDRPAPEQQSLFSSLPSGPASTRTLEERGESKQKASDLGELADNQASLFHWNDATDGRAFGTESLTLERRSVAESRERESSSEWKKETSDGDDDAPIAKAESSARNAPTEPPSAATATPASPRSGGEQAQELDLQLPETEAALEQQVAESREMMLELMNDSKIVDISGATPKWKEDPLETGSGSIVMRSKSDEYEAKSQMEGLRTTIKTIEGLGGDELIKAAVELGISNPTLINRYPEYETAKLQERALLDSGLAPNHPKVLEVKETSTKLKEMLVDAVDSTKRTLGTKLALAEESLDFEDAKPEDALKQEEGRRLTDYQAARDRYVAAQAKLSKLREQAVQADKKKDKQPADLSLETLTSDEPFSTFSLNVSDVSFKLAKTALLDNNTFPEAAKVRPEEFVNAFDYGDPAPSLDAKVACQIDQAAHPFLQQRNLMRVSMRTAAAGRAASQPLRLTILLDKSGSMERADREESVLRTMQALAKHLGPADQITAIAFARQPQLIADRLAGDRAKELVSLVAATPSEGGTNLEEALKLAETLAVRQFEPAGTNRIVLITDGAANLGDADPESLMARVVQLRQQGIAFDACGVGADGLNDATLEALTRKGDGRYYFLDRPEDADANFVRQLAGSLRPAAKNVKVQVKFNPGRVTRYRLAGFEKHRLDKEDFRNDKVDAAEMAAAESGNALYQFEADPQGSGDIGEVFVRFLDANTNQMVERSWPIPYQPKAPRLSEATPSMQLAATAGLLAEKLKGGGTADAITLGDLSPVTTQLRASYQQDPRVLQLIQMVERTRSLTGE